MMLPATGVRRSPIIVALDFADPTLARELVARLQPGRCRLKVGKELFVRAGPSLVADWVSQGWDVFLDLKFHDIPNTVAGACRAAAELGVWMVNVHALGGGAMLEAARESLQELGHRPLLIAVTMLTSHDRVALEQIGLPGTPVSTVTRLAALARQHGLDGVVCSAHEAPALRSAYGPEFRLVTPGIRSAGDTGGDQTRIMTPAGAWRAGADYLVIGRPITRASDPMGALESIETQLAIYA